MRESQNDKKKRAVATYASLARAADTVSLILDRQSESMALSPGQYRILEYLAQLGPTTPGELADRILRSDSTLTRILANLESAGLVVRRAHERDRRKVRMHLTPKGQKLVDEILPLRAKIIRAEMCVLGKGEQETLERICSKLAEGDVLKFAMEITAIDEDEG